MQSTKLWTIALGTVLLASGWMLPTASAQALVEIHVLPADAPDVRVDLVAYDDRGEAVWQIPIPAVSAGSHPLLPDLLPEQSLSRLQVRASAPGHLTAEADLVPSYAAGGLRLAPRSVGLKLQPLSAWLTLILLLPGLVGLGWALFFLTRFPERPELSLRYTFWIGVAWGGVILSFAVAYLFGGNHLVPLFWPDLHVSTGVVVFALLGSLTYVAYSIYDKDDGFFVASQNTAQLRKYLRAVGGRVLVAPYVAVAAQAILATVFPVLRTGPAALFLAFFTGLWIKVVLGLLHDVGGRFLSAEAARRLSDRLIAADVSAAPKKPTTPPGLPGATAALDDTARRARQELAAKAGVLGVGPGQKVTAGRNTGEEAIVVYVDGKRTLPDDHPDLVPTIVGGVRTDVVELAPADSAAPCHGTAFDLLWDKIYRQHQGQLRRAGSPFAAGDPDVVRRGDVLVLTAAAAHQLFYRYSDRRDQMFVPRSAYDLVRPKLGDHYDFVAFVLDTDSGLAAQGHYYVPVHNDVDGIHFFRDPPDGRFSERSAWGSVRLVGCQVHGRGRDELSRRFLLHELGHAWSAYVTYRSGARGGIGDLLRGASPGAGRHWSESFDNGVSCMDYDGKRWVHLGGDLYRQETVPPEELGYCELDLYLMGLLPQEKVPPLKIVRSRTPGEEPGTFHTTVEEVDVQAVAADCGEHRHAAGAAPRTYRQAFVVVTLERASGEALADHVEGLRKRHEESFFQATGEEARLLTDLIG